MTSSKQVTTKKRTRALMTFVLKRAIFECGFRDHCGAMSYNSFCCPILVDLVEDLKLLGETMPYDDEFPLLFLEMEFPGLAAKLDSMSYRSVEH